MAKKTHDIPLLGAHTSTAGGLHNALYEGRDIGATTVQIFTSNQRQWRGRVLDDEQLARWRQALAETGLQQIMSHDSYLINLGAVDEEILHKSRAAIAQELQRCQQLDIAYLNFHPGAAGAASRQRCLDTIVASLLLLEGPAQQGHTRLLLECTAGQGTAVGSAFEELGYIIDRVEDRVPVGVCLDTCHAFAAGYDVRDAAAWETTLQAFDRAVGLRHLYAFHLNDSLKGLGSHVDRHRPLGEGAIGLDCFRFLMNDPRTRALPKYLETPDGPPLWKKEIALLKSMIK